MNLTISPTSLKGTITPPPSKSITHRLILAAALSEGSSVIHNIAFSEDILATLRCAEVLGAAWKLVGGTLHMTGCGGRRIECSKPLCFDCGESGSTLRFLIPIALALAGGGIFTGKGRLMERPLGPYLDLFREKEITFEQKDNTLTVHGALQSGEYRLAGNVSSQFFTGLLFALPLLKGPSLIVPTTALESVDYIAMTVDALARSGISIASTFTLPPNFSVPGSSSYRPFSATVEPDWSQAAFWYAANEAGSSVSVAGMVKNSLQGDSIFPQWMEMLWKNSTVTIDAAQYPDLVPPLTARAVTMNGTLYITKIGRLRMKESDRIAAIANTLSAIGADISAGEDSLTIHGKKQLRGGVSVDAHGDHRIAMMLAIAALRCMNPVTITGAECVRKSYPYFWEDYKALGGIVHEHSGK